MNLRELNERLITHKIHSEQAATAYAHRRKEVEQALLDAYTTIGAKTLVVTLPGAGEVATITLKQGPVELDVDEDVFFKAVQDHQPNEIEEAVDPAAWDDPEVLALLLKHRPDAVTRRVRPAWRTARLKEAQANSGRITVNADTGETVKIANVTWHDPTGAFQLTFASDGGMERAAAALAQHSTSRHSTSQGATPTPQPPPQQDNADKTAPAKTTRKRTHASAR